MADGMRRHLVTLEREERNLEQAIDFCQTLKDREVRLDDLDAGELLEKMEELERAGTTFLNRQKDDTRPIRYAGAVAMALLMSAIMVGVIILMAWGFTVDPEDAPPLPLAAVLMALPGVVILGVILSLVQRIGEIRKGEEDDAKNY